MQDHALAPVHSYASNTHTYTWKDRIETETGTDRRSNSVKLNQVAAG